MDEITRPTLILNRARVEANIDAMVAVAQRADVRLRPHFKTHQSAEIGSWFRARGIAACTVSSLTMARYFADAGWTDITVAFPVNPRERDLIRALNARIELGLLVDSEEAARLLDEILVAPAPVWVKVDAGYGRAGLHWSRGGAVWDLASTLNEGRRTRFAGLLCHAGDSYAARGRTEIATVHARTMMRMETLQDHLQSRGIACPVSVGDTPTCSVADDFTPAEEIRPGNFVFYDLEQHEIGSCDLDQIAVAVACPVVSVYPDRGEALIHGGSVHFSKDRLSRPDGRFCYGLGVVNRGREGWGDPILGRELFALSQEHGRVRISGGTPPRIGDLLVFLPVHVCLTADRYSAYRSLEGTTIERFSDP